MRKSVLIHSIVFSPDAVSTAYLYSDIAIGLQKLGHDVKVITTIPHYNVVEEAVQKQGLKKRILGLYQKSDYHGIPVYHIPATKSKSVIIRLLSFCYFHLLALLLSLHVRKIDIVLSPSPPLTMGLIGIIIAWLKGGKAIYNVQEIYPDFIINQGALKNRIVIKALKKLERFVYNHSRMVITIDERFADIIRPRISKKENLYVIPNFVDTLFYRPLPKINQWSCDMPFSDKFIVMYAGNIGLAQDWEPILYAAKKVASFPIHILIIGEGASKKRLSDSIKEQGIENISLMDYQNRLLMPFINTFADIHFISMNPDMDKEGFPSKVYCIFSSGVPLVVSTAGDSPLANLIHTIGAGIVSEVNNNDAFVNDIMRYYHDPELRKKHGSIGREFVTEHFGKEQIVTRYHKLIELA